MLLERWLSGMSVGSNSSNVLMGLTRFCSRGAKLVLISQPLSCADKLVHKAERKKKKIENLICRKGLIRGRNLSWMVLSLKAVDINRLAFLNSLL